MESSTEKFLPGVRVVARSPGFRVATWDRVAIHKLIQGEDVECLRARARAHDMLRAAYGERVLSLTIAVEGCSLPDATVRAEASQVMKRLAPNTQSIVVVVEGSGFWKSAARSVLTSVQLLVPREQRMRIAETLDEGCSLLAAEAGESTTWVRQLRNVVEAL